MISETVLVIRILEVVKWNQNFVFQKQKRKALVFHIRTVGKYGASWKVEWGFYGTFNGSVKGGPKRKRKVQTVFVLNQGRIENPTKSRSLFSQKSSQCKYLAGFWICLEFWICSDYTEFWMTRAIVNLWQGSKYASDSEYVRVLNILGYIIYATASGIFKTLDHLEYFLFWHINVYLGIFRHCFDI